MQKIVSKPIEAPTAYVPPAYVPPPYVPPPFVPLTSFPDDDPIRELLKESQAKLVEEGAD